MRVVGIRRAGTVDVDAAALSPDGASVTVIAPLAGFWADAAGHLGHEPDGPTIRVESVRLVPPVLPDARASRVAVSRDHGMRS